MTTLINAKKIDVDVPTQDQSVSPINVDLIIKDVSDHDENELFFVSRRNEIEMDVVCHLDHGYLCVSDRHCAFSVFASMQTNGTAKVGHCVLYHTFQTSDNEEDVNKDGGNEEAETKEDEAAEVEVEEEAVASVMCVHLLQLPLTDFEQGLIDSGDWSGDPKDKIYFDEYASRSVRSRYSIHNSVLCGLYFNACCEEVTNEFLGSGCETQVGQLWWYLNLKKLRSLSEM